MNSLATKIIPKCTDQKRLDALRMLTDCAKNGASKELKKEIFMWGFKG
jgi:hypothetical protein